MRIAAKVLIGVACAACAHCACIAQGNGIVCTQGEGRFSMQSNTGVTVVVDAQRGKGFATRACEAKLLWNKNEIAVVGDAWQADVDVMDVDLGLGAKAVAFQFKQTENASSMTYMVYSLRGAPELVRTLTGGDFFRAADTDLDGRIEIWAGDASATNAFEGIPAANIDFPPTIVMRFEKRRLIDVSAEFRPAYDQKIAQVKADLDSKQLTDFKNSDGRFGAIPPWETDRIRSLQKTRIKALEIVWAYLYSGREQEAWHALSEMWPAEDVSRIRSLISKARAEGLASQVDGVSQSESTARKGKQIRVYDLRTSEKTTYSPASAAAHVPQVERSTSELSPSKDITMPKAISLFSRPPADLHQADFSAGLLVDLVIDEAGKVSSARLVRKEDEGPVSASLLSAADRWKFIPAMEYGQAIASHIHLMVSPYQ